MQHWPFCDEKSVQLVRVASFQSDFLQNPYFSETQKKFKNWKVALQYSNPWLVAQFG